MEYLGISTDKNVTMNDETIDGVLTFLNNSEAKNLLPVMITLVVLMFVGIVGNSLVVQVYWCRMRRSAKRTFILTLALLDLSVCTIVIPFELYDLRNQVLFDHEEICKAMRLLEYVTVLSGGFVLVSISFERYYFLCRAFQEFSPRKAKIVCFTCVTVALLMSIPSAYFAGFKTRHLEYGDRNITGRECSMNAEKHKGDSFKSIYYYVLSAIFFGCFVVFIILYSMIGRLLWKYQHGKMLPSTGCFSKSSTTTSNGNVKKVSLDHSSGQSHASSTSKKDGQMTLHGRRSIRSAGTIIVFFSVTVVFVISFLPHLVIRIIMLVNKVEEGLSRETFDLIYNFTVRSYLLSNVANPFIYSILNQSFRKQLKRTFICFKCARSENTSNLLTLHG
ncbi:neuropeptide receptor npr-1-like [Mya arenaria]|uniref:neuropeptide receptor npr-1-like n=1 Tax=Mya arenaria TaxID=6604 RepID=UPI0022E3DDA7|nr:neuropeptide receptor npr-1-like [Mya arenaria]